MMLLCLVIVTLLSPLFAPAATQEAVDAYNALGTCLCQDSCGTECAGACGG